MSRVSAEKAELANQRKGVKAALREAKRARESARGEFYELYERPVESLERRLAELDEELGTSGPTQEEE